MLEWKISVFKNFTAQAFEAGDFLNYFLRFWGFWVLKKFFITCMIYFNCWGNSKKFNTSNAKFGNMVLYASGHKVFT